MITVTTDDLAEARDLTLILAEHYAWPYRILLNGREFRLGSAPATRLERRSAAWDLIAAAGPDGISIRDLQTALYRKDFQVSKATLWRYVSRWADDGKVTSFIYGQWAVVPGKEP